jgi:hypothetical protein
MRSVLVALAGLISFAACGPPPPPPPRSAQRLLVERVKPEPVEGASGLASGATVRIGGMTLAIDRLEGATKPRDHTREAITTAMSLAATSGVKEVKKAQEVVTDAFALADALGRIFGKSDEKTDFTAHADADGRSYVISCSTSIELRGIDDRERPSETCAIAPASAAPDHVWKLELKTVGGKSQAFSFPVTLTRSPAGESFWMNRPDRQSNQLADYSAFVAGKDGGGGPNLGRLVVAGTRQAYLDGGVPIEAESRDVLRITFALLSIVDWSATQRP